MNTKVKESSKSRKRQHRPRTPGQSTISSKNQITLPVDVLREAGFGPGTRLEAIVRSSGEIILLDADESPGERIRRAAGIFSGMYPPNYLEDLRKDWDDRP